MTFETKAHEAKSCGKCGGEMVLGHIPDFGRRKIWYTTWVSGPAERSWWTGGIKSHLTKAYPLEAYRCSGCSYVELYAPRSYEKVLDSDRSA